MLRRIFTGVSVLSLLLFVAVLALWLVSWRWEVGIVHTSTRPLDNGWQFMDGEARTDSGYVVFQQFSGVSPPGISKTPSRWRFGARRSQAFSWGHLPIREAASILGINVTRIYIPFWCLLVLSLPLPVAWTMGYIWRRANRDPSRCCCGYDLTCNVSAVYVLSAALPLRISPVVESGKAPAAWRR